MAFSPRAVASSGLVTIAVDTATDGALLELGNGVTLQGLKITDDVGAEKNGVATHAELAVFVRCRNGNAGTIAHQHSSMSAAHRIRVVGTAADLAVSADSLVLLLYATTESRWLAYDLQRDNSGAVAAAIAAAIIAHEEDENPHPQYTTSSEVDSAAASAVSTHVAAANPHSQYPRELRYSGTTAGSGTYSQTFNPALGATPNVQVQIIGGTPNHIHTVTRSTTGFTVTTYLRSSINLLGSEVLLATTSTVNGITVDVTVTRND